MPVAAALWTSQREKSSLKRLYITDNQQIKPYWEEERKEQ